MYGYNSGHTKILIDFVDSVYKVHNHFSGILIRLFYFHIFEEIITDDRFV